MRRIAIITAVVMALALLTASFAAAGSNEGVEKLDIVQEFDTSTGEATEGPVVGKARLVRGANGLVATASAAGLEPGGVYTFWWVIPAETHPDASFVALGGSKIVGQNGKATVRMRATVGDQSIEGFFETLAPLGVPDTWAFVPLTSDLLDDRIRIEIAYHGQADSSEYNSQWLLDFWTGQIGVCADTSVPVMAITGQPHCPTFQAAESPGTP